MSFVAFLEMCRELTRSSSGALAYGISHANASIPNWRLVFLIEGIPAVLIAPLVYFYLPDKASTAWFLTPREKEISLARGVRDGNAGRDLGLSMSVLLYFDQISVCGLEWRSDPRLRFVCRKKVFGGLTDPKAFIHSLMYFSSNVSCTLPFNSQFQCQHLRVIIDRVFFFFL